MATANELFHDAILRRQLHLLLFGNELGADINATLRATEDEIRGQMQRRLRTIIARGFDTSPDTTSRLRLLAAGIADIRRGALSRGRATITAQLRQVTNDEASYINRATLAVSPVHLDTVLPSTSSLGAIVTSTPFQGSVMSEWSAGLLEADTDRIMRTIRVGLVRGLDMDDIAESVFASGGIADATERDVNAIARTAVAAFSNEARDAYFQANDDIFEEEVYVATLDSHTTPLCISLDGNRYKVGEGPIPGRDTHWNCRSVRVALINGELIGDRPAAAWTEDDLDGLNRADRRARIRELTGTVPARTTYPEWFAEQSDPFQNSVLGPARGSLFREGRLNLKTAVSATTGRRLTLKQLRAAEPLALGE